MTTSLHFTNTLTRAKQPFVPLTPGKVGMYVCGITPYDYAHIGHGRVYTVFDVLFRLLRHTYGPENVTYVRNITDIEDKIITRAAEAKTTPEELTRRFAAEFHQDMEALGNLSPTVEPWVTQHLPGIVAMLDELIAKGFAYTTPSGDVMYRTAKFPKFGALARRKLSEQQAGARVDVDDEKEFKTDFVLWKANAKSTTKMEQAFVPSDYRSNKETTPFNAPGRPGWHIECSVMSRAHLGPVFDIHGGGEDLIFPHHCCEIAQSEALLAPGQDMARFWLHNSFITTNGTKMSKSLNNFTTLRDVLNVFAPQAVRLWLLQTHYRKPVDFSPEALKAAETRWKRYGATQPANELGNAQPPQAFWDALADDLNTPQALAVLDGATPEERAAGLLFLGITLPTADTQPLLPEHQALLEARTAARTAKNWAESDRLRDELLAQGIAVKDGPEGTTWERL
jgi:cysteinyl-tRNA synthetase